MEQIIQLVVFDLYVLYVWYKVGVLKSISHSYYAIKQNHLFTLTLFAVGLLNCFNPSVWHFFAGTFLCFAGAAASFEDWNTTKWVHNIGAGGAIVLALIGLATEGYYYTAIPIILAIFLIKDNRIWWVEVVAFHCILINLIIWQW